MIELFLAAGCLAAGFLICSLVTFRMAKRRLEVASKLCRKLQSELDKKPW